MTLSDPGARPDVSESDETPLEGSTREAAQRIRTAIDRAGEGLVEREVLVELLVLGAVAREHLLVIGPPGTAKSAAVRRVATALGGSYFEYLLGRFTEPSELFGPVDLRKLRDGRIETATDGMLPEAEIAFLDEVFQGSTAILNTLLGLLHDRRFRRGHTMLDCPLRLAVGASNHLPEDPSLAAFADRFLLRHFALPITDPLLDDLLEQGWQVDLADSKPELEAPVATLADLDTLASAVRTVTLDGVRPLLAQALRRLRSAGVRLSDRRAVKSQRLVAAAAVLDGRSRADARDLWPLVDAVPDPEAQALARECLRELLAESDNRTLARAAEDASHGPEARARRLVDAGRELLGEDFSRLDSELSDAELLAAEGLSREIDIGFAADRRTEALDRLYGRLAELLSRQEPGGT